MQGITGACGREYTVRTADEGHTLRVRLTVTESDGQAAVGGLGSDCASCRDAVRDPNVGDETDTCVTGHPDRAGQGHLQLGHPDRRRVRRRRPARRSRSSSRSPSIRIAGRFKGTRTTLTRVTVKTPRGTRIRIRCSGKGCPFKRKAVAAKLISLRSLRRTYRPKATIEIRVTKAKKIGKYTRVRTRRGKAPVRIDRCLMPGKTKPVRCPAG